MDKIERVIVTQDSRGDRSGLYIAMTQRADMDMIGLSDEERGAAHTVVTGTVWRGAIRYSTSTEDKRFAFYNGE